MSRIGKAPITLPAGVEFNVDNANVVHVKGPQGSFSTAIHPDLSVEMEEGTVVVKRPTEQKRHRAMHGLYRTLISNAVEGVHVGYKKELELHGVGYRANNTGNLLELALGYSHTIFFYIPDELKLETVTEKGKPPRIIVSGVDKTLVGQVAAKIRAFRKPEPYKGKGIRYVGEQIRRKAGKTAG